MSSQSEKMGAAEGIALVFVLTSSRLFLSTPVQGLECGASLGWTIIVVSGVITFASFYALLFAYQRFPGDLISMAERLTGKLGAWIIGLYYTIAFLFNGISMNRQFADNTLLTALPDLDLPVAVILYGIVAVLLVYNGIEGLARATYFLLPYGLTGLFFVLFALIPRYNLHYLFPWEGNGLDYVVLEGVSVAGTNIGILALFILAPAFQNGKTINTIAGWGLGGSTFLRALTTLIFILVFGIKMGSEKMLPFYEMSRVVMLSRFIQRVEALFIVLWVIFGVVSIAISIYLACVIIGRLLKLPTIQPIIPAVGVISIVLAMLPADINTVVEWDGILIRKCFNVGIYLIPLLLLVIAWFKERKGGVKCASQ